MLRLKLRNFFVKLTHWEYWPAYVIYFPVFFYWLILALMRRDLFFFSRANSSIFSGGLFGASKTNILRQMPQAYVPNGVLIKSDNTYNLPETLSVKKIEFPLIVKPDIAERGLGIRILKNEAELNLYRSCASFDFIIQEFLDLPYEIGVLFSRFGEDDLEVHSICTKEKMCIIGNGVNSIKELILASDRYRLQHERLSQERNLNTIPKKGNKILLEPIGNHSRGTTFRDGSHLYSKQLFEVMKKITSGIKPEISYGRFDFLCSSHEDFLDNKNIYIVELNGSASEPIHIYEPGSSFFKAQKSIFKISTILYKISKKRGRGKGWIHEFRTYTKRFSFYRKNIKGIKESMVEFDSKRAT